MTALPVHLARLARATTKGTVLMTIARSDTPPPAAAIAAGAASSTRHRPIPTAGAVADDALAAAWSAGVARGDPESLDALYRAWFDRVYGAARAHTRRDEAFCLDVVQETMLRVIRSMKPLSGRAALEAYMHATVRSACLDALRSEARRAARHARAARADEPGNVQVILDDLEALSAALTALGAPERELIDLRFARDRTLAAAGRISGRTGAAAHGLIRRAMKRLRNALDGDGTEMKP